MVGTSERPDLPLAVVVGAGGMAMSIARRLGQHYRILLADKNSQHVKQCAAFMCDEGHDVVPAVCDVTDPKAIAALRDEAAARGPLRVLAHVVGLSPSMADWQSIMRVDLVGAQLMADTMLDLAEPGTSAIFISSNGAYMFDANAAVKALLDDPLQPDLMHKIEKALGKEPTTVVSYCLSKLGVNRMCERMAPAWGKKGARINSLSPGQIATPMGRLEWKNRPIKVELLKKQPIPREGTMNEIADGVEFLASSKSSFITGSDLLVDGGMTASVRHDPNRPQVEQ